ncbi:hypothetical protein PIL02S_03948 [Paenibacillus illinoisensis]|uniref:Uncharacterized protein n=1 Tax=Paenibacillus illinoisensis TaxID=59845 RepID=A0A2W0C555_9BACL|nr:hypothetical protein PIL02S_03948 [Paenibacillus illinoisensis]
MRDARDGMDRQGYPKKKAPHHVLLPTGLDPHLKLFRRIFHDRFERGSDSRPAHLIFTVFNPSIV